MAVAFCDYLGRRLPIVSAEEPKIAERFDADDWRILERELSHGEIIRQHNRLYRSLAFGYEDYLFSVAEVIASLVDADAENLPAMESYIEKAHAVTETISILEAAEDKRTCCLVFISHKAEEKSFASSLKGALMSYGIDSFVAHEDIHVTVEWEREIERMLRCCDAFVYLASQMSNASPWCQQEIGWAFGRNIPMMSVTLNADPIGFFGTRQPSDVANRFKLTR